jgi:hypothetical protein
MGVFSGCFGEEEAFCPGNGAKIGMFLVVGVFCPGNWAKTGIKSSFRPHKPMQTLHNLHNQPAVP